MVRPEDSHVGAFGATLGVIVCPIGTSPGFFGPDWGPEDTHVGGFWGDFGVSLLPLEFHSGVFRIMSHTQKNA